jgi:flagellar L-ring protein FlgH
MKISFFILTKNYAFSAVALLYILAGCTGITPSTIISNGGRQQPAPINSQASSGSIYSAATYKPIFEGIKARKIGDTVTVIITENTATSNSVDDKNAKTGSAVSTSTNMQGNNVQPTWNISNSNASETNNSGLSTSVFSGSIAATVNEVLPNGFLVVVGEKQLGRDQGAQFIRFSGVVNPSMITTDNSVASNTIADARVEYRTNNYMDSSYISSMLVRFFYNILPF